MTRICLTLLLAFCDLASTLLFAEKPNWTFTEEQLRLFAPPLEADAETMCEWVRMLESPVPNDTKLWGSRDKYREQVQLMRIMACRAILATEPSFALEEKAWWMLWFPYVLLSEQNQNEWLPKMKAVYDELTELSHKKGEVLDQQTTLYLRLRGAFLDSILEKDKSFLPNGDKLLDEIGRFVEKHRQLDSLGTSLYDAQSRALKAMVAVDEKYGQIQTDSRAEWKECVIQNEDRLQLPMWYHMLFPLDPYNTPEKQVEAYRLIEKFHTLIDTNNETKRFDAEGVRTLYHLQTMLFSSLIDANEAANIPRLRAYLETLEKKNDPQLSTILYSGYRNIWNKKLPWCLAIIDVSVFV